MDNKCDLFLQDIESQSIEGRKKCREILSMSPFTHLLMFTVISVNFPLYYLCTPKTDSREGAQN